MEWYILAGVPGRWGAVGVGAIDLMIPRMQ